MSTTLLQKNAMMLVVLMLSASLAGCIEGETSEVTAADCDAIGATLNTTAAGVKFCENVVTETETVTETVYQNNTETVTETVYQNNTETVYQNNTLLNPGILADVRCGPAGNLAIAGSSTVKPMAEAWAEYYNAACSDITVTVEGGGSGGGAGRVCANSAKGTPVDIGDMSRDWKATEASRGPDGYTMSCLAGDTTRQALQIQVAVDGLSVVTKTGGAAQTCIASMSGGGLTVEQLRWVFSAESLAEVATATGVAASEITPNDDGDAVKEWSDLSSNSACISSQIDLAYPDGESGTYEYFLEAVLHETPAGFGTGQQSADDNVLVNELVQNGDSIGYFGYAYYVENQDTLTAVPVKNSAGDYVGPTSTSVQDGTYNPLSRPLFMNLHAADASLAKSAPFLEFGLFTQGGDALTESVGYVPLGPELDAEMEARISSDGIVCGPAGNIEIAGSSTVLPLAEAWAEDYNAACDGITVSVNGGGSGAGAGRVCANSAKGTPVDIGDMSRDWKATEASRDADGFTMSCLAGDTARQAAQLQVAIDGLSVVMKTGGAAQACVAAMGGLTISQLHWIFSSNTTAEIAAIHGESASAVVSNDDGDSTKEWSDLSSDAACLANEIDIAYPDGESGTFEYFCEVALEEVCSFRTGQQSADDNVLVTALVGNGDAIGYFGYAYYVENQDTLTAAAIRNGDGVYVTPTATTVRDGSYEPLSRPLFMNVHINAASLVKTIPFMVYGLDTHAGQEAVAEVGYVALNDAQLADMMHRRLTVLAVSYTDSDFSLRGELCGQGQTITIAGSSTVKPLAEAWAQDFQAFCSGYTISVEGGGSGAGAGRVCGNSAKGTPVNIGDMSRDWKATEASRGNDGYTMSCLAGDTTITVTQLTVAIDGLSVVMKSGGAAAACVGAMGGLTVPQLRWIFSTNSTADVAFENGLSPSAIAANDDGDATKEWGDLSTNSACVDDEIDIVFPDGESGTYEYFNEVVLDEKGQFRTGTQSADDNVLVEGLTGNGDAIGYFGYAYYIANTDVLVAAAVENSAGQMVLPTSTTVRDGSYEPLSRPLFMNVNNADWGKVKPFLEWAWSSLGEESIHEVGYVPLDQATWYEMSERFQ